MSEFLAHIFFRPPPAEFTAALPHKAVRGELGTPDTHRKLKTNMRTEENESFHLLKKEK